MTARRALAILVGVSVLGFAPAADGITPPIPSIPIPGVQKAKFRVTVEGSAWTRLDSDWGASLPCLVDIHASVTETTRYLRGKGVVIEFVRYQAGRRRLIVVQRAGRTGDASLTVVATTTRTAIGHSRRGTPPNHPQCPEFAKDLSTADCSVPERTTDKARLTYFSGRLGFEMRTLGALNEDSCGDDEQGASTNQLKWAWPGARQLTPAPLTPATIFGRRRVIVVKLVGPLKKSGPTYASAGTLSGTRTDFGKNQLTIRLVRLR